MENYCCSFLRHYKDFTSTELTGTGLEFHAHTGDVNLTIRDRRTSTTFNSGQFRHHTLVRSQQ